MTLFGPGNVRVRDLDLSGVDPVTGAAFGVEPPDGWSGSPAGTLEATQRVRQGGAWLSGDYPGTRHISLKGWVQGDPGILLAALDRLNTAARPGVADLVVSEFGVDRRVSVRREDEVISTRVRPDYAEWSVQFMAVGRNPDIGEWRKFDLELTGVTAGPLTSGGLTVPFTVPFTVPATTVSGSVALTNAGNATGPVVARIDGPTVDPWIVHQQSGLVVSFVPGFTLRTGEFLVIDMEARSVLAQGTATRSMYLAQRGWSGFVPGVNVWSFAQTSGSGQLTVTATPAWL